MINLNVEGNTGKTFNVRVTKEGDGIIDIYVNEWAVLKLSENKGKFSVEAYDAIEDKDFDLDEAGAVIVKTVGY